MAISRARAKAIHEVNSWALWATGVALLFRLAFMGESEGFDLITGAMIIAFVSMVLMYLLLPPVPTRRTRKRPTHKRKRR